MAYQRPMVTVDQNMTVKPVSTEREQPAFVFGPQYELHRYGEESEKEGTKAARDWSGEQVSFPYPNVIDANNVDNGFTKLHGENVVVQLADLTKGATVSLPDPSDSEEVLSNGGYSRVLIEKDYIDDDSSSPYDGLNRKLKAGDSVVVLYSNGDGAQSVMASIKEVKYSASGHDINSDSSADTQPGTLITIDDVIPAEGLVANSVEIRLVSVLPSYEFDRRNFAKYEGSNQAYEDASEDPGMQWVQEKTTNDAEFGTFYGITVNDLNALVTSNYFKNETWCKVLFADLYVTYREIVTVNSDTIHTLVGGSTEVSGILGTVSPDNPLAMGVYMAALNAATDDGTQAPSVYYMAVPTDDVEGYRKVMGRAATTDLIYILAPTTQNETVLDELKEHVKKYSSKEEKLWRIAAGSAAIPRTVNRIDSLLDPQGDDFLAIPVSKSGIAPNSGPYNKLRIVKSANDTSGSADAKLGARIQKGDFVRFNFRDSAWENYGYPQVFDTYKVVNVVNSYTIEVESLDGSDGVDTTGLTELTNSYKPSKIEVYHEYTSTETAELIASISRNFATRRMLNVFPSEFSNNGVKMSGEFAACAVAGLVSATEPQQPITNMPLSGIDNVPETYETYNKEELDVMAAGGTFIVAQDLPNDIVYVRHQITTATYEGNLNTRELSVTKDVDSISYAFADAFEPYYGKYNITENLTAILETTARGLIAQLGASDSLYGPQLIYEGTTLNYIRQNELFKDHVDVSISLQVPYPCNVIEIVLTV